MVEEWSNNLPPLEFKKARQIITITIYKKRKTVHKATIYNSIRTLQLLDDIQTLIEESIPLKQSIIVEFFNSKYGPFNNPKDMVRNYLDILTEGNLVKRIEGRYQFLFKIIYGTENGDDDMKFFLNREKQRRS